MLALAGGAAMAGRGKGTAFPRPKAGTIDQMAADAADSAPVVKNVIKPTAPVDTAPIRSEGRTRLSVDGVTPGMVLNARRKVPGYGSAVAPPGILNPYNPRTHSIRGMKKGGRVTGIAKRGFGRALMKGKK